MTFLTKSQILERRPPPFEDHVVPEWPVVVDGKSEPGTVRVQGLTALEADRFNASLVKRNGGQVEMDRENYCAKLLSQCLVDESGARMLSEADVAALGAQSAGPIQRLAIVAERLSGLNQQAVIDAAKN